jgi:O-methyltransferase
MRILFAFAALGFVTMLAIAAMTIYLFSHPRVTLKAEAVPVAVALQTSPEPNTTEERYLDLLKLSLTRALVAPAFERRTLNFDYGLRRLAIPAHSLLNSFGLELVRVKPAGVENYSEGGYAATNRVEDAETMIGTKQLDNLQFCIREVLRHNVPGDLIEAGAWRGGVTIFMRGALQAYGDRQRRVFVADSFEGLPQADESLNYEHQRKWLKGEMAASIEEVRNNFARYRLLDQQVVFLKGYFNQTLPKAPIERLAILRADADLYESTRDVLENLYPKLSPGGYAIFDDYLVLPDCRRAIDDYRASHRIAEPIQIIDKQAIYWQKSGPSAAPLVTRK